MKKLILLVALATAFVACEKKQQMLDPNAKISIKPATKSEKTNVMRIKEAKFENFLSDLEIVKQADAITMWAYHLNAVWYESTVGFAGKDTTATAPKILMWGTAIITQKGELLEEFIKGYDMVLVRYKVDNPHTTQDFDTIGYIPNSQVRAAETIIRQAWAIEDYNTIYEVFNEMFTFKPIDHKGWEELKAKNEQ